MSTRAILFMYGGLIIAVPLAWFLGGPIGLVIASVVGTGILIAAHRMKGDGEEQFDTDHSSLFAGHAIPWATPKEPSHKPNLLWSGWQFANVTYDRALDIWREGVTGFRSTAYVLQFANMRDSRGKGTAADGLRAQVIWTYPNGSLGPAFLPSAWVDEQWGLVSIGIGCSKKLILGVKVESSTPLGNYWNGYSNPRTKEGDVHRMDGQMLPEDGVCHVQIMNETGDILFERKWKWTENLDLGAHPTATPL